MLLHGEFFVLFSDSTLPTMSSFEINFFENTYSNSDAVLSGEPSDRYPFQLQDPSNLNLSFPQLNAGMDWKIEDDLGQVIDSGFIDPESTDSIQVNDLVAGNYVLELSRQDSDTDYTLNLEVDPLTGEAIVPNNDPIESGYFTVGESGKVGVSFEIDGGAYRGELAIFSLSGLDEFALGSPEWIKEVSRRALSNSALGGIAIRDASEGARLDVNFSFENNYNSGDYQGNKEFDLTPGDKFGVMLVPNGTVAEVFENPEIEGNKTPLFSLATANPEDAFHVGQLADITGEGRVFVLEDQRVDAGSDGDYNDIVFRVTGAVGEAVNVSSVIDPGKNWTTDPTVIGPLNLPEVSISLSTDSGVSNSDRVTKTATVSGSINSQNAIAKLQAGFGDTAIADFTDITDALEADGTFSLDRDRLSTIFGGQVFDGQHTLFVQAIDENQGASNFAEIVFTLDSANPSFNFESELENATFEPGDRLTGTATGTGSDLVFFSYQIDSGAEISINPDASGGFDTEINLDNTSNGDRTLTVKAIDRAGNQTVETYNITVANTNPGTDPLIDAFLASDTGISATDSITNFARIDGQLSNVASIDKFEGSFDGQTFVEIGENLWNDGRFILDRAELENIYGSALPDGDRTLYLKATTVQGNESTLAVPFTLDTVQPTLDINEDLDGKTIDSETRLQGLVGGTGSEIVGLTYQLDNGVEKAIAIDNDTFDTPLDLDGVSNGQHTLTLTTVDTAGNTTTTSFNVNVGEIIAPTVTIELQNDTGESDSDRVTRDPSVRGNVTDDGEILWLKAGFQNPDTQIPIDENGHFSLTRQQLETLYGDRLPDGEHTLFLLAADTDGNPSPLVEFNFTLETPPLEIVSVSPTHTEEDVSLEREIVIRFSAAVDPDTVNNDSIKVYALGDTVDGNWVVNSTGEFARFFPTEDGELDIWDSSARVRLDINGDAILGLDGAQLDADNDGTPGGTRTTEFETVAMTRLSGTEVWGYVYDSYNTNPDGENIPIAGATIRVDGLPEANAVTDENGFFVLEDVPGPDFFVHIDGSTATNAPDGMVYPNVGKPFHSIPGQSIQLTMDGTPFDVFLPPMDPGDMQQLSETEVTEVGFGKAAKAALIDMNPDIDPAVWDRAKVEFQPGTQGAVDKLGNAATQAAIIPVPSDRIPGPLPQGLTPKLVFSIQAFTETGPANNFDVPAAVTLPNLEGLEPGEKAEILSFNHDSGRWETVGTGTVSDDGLTVESDPGVGILAPGWHAVSAVTIGDDCEHHEDISVGGESPEDPIPPGSHTVDVEPVAVISGVDSDLYIDSEDNSFTFTIENQAQKIDPSLDSCHPDNAAATPLVVEIKIKGPALDFLDISGINAEGGLESYYDFLEDDLTLKYKLLPGEKTDFQLDALSLEEIRENLGRGPIGEVLGAEFCIKAYQLGDEDNVLIDEEFDIYRVIGDRDGFNGIFQFADTVNDGEGGIERVLPFRLNTGPSDKPTFEVSEPFSFRTTGNPNVGEFVFDPTETRDDITSNVNVVSPSGQVVGTFELQGDGVQQQWYLDEDAFEMTLERLATGALDGATDAEKTLIDTPEERAAIVSNVIAKTETLLSEFSVGIQRSETSNDSTVNIDVFSTAESRDDSVTFGDGILGNAFLNDNKSNGGIVDLIVNREQYSNSELYFRFSEVLNENYDGQVDLYLDNYFNAISQDGIPFEWDNEGTDKLEDALAKTIAHEIGHNLGLEHTFGADSNGNTKLIDPAQFPGFFMDVMSSGLSPDTDFTFAETGNALKVALGLDWTQEEAQDAFDYFTSYYQASEGWSNPFDSVSGVSHVDPDDIVTIGSGVLYSFDRDGNYTTSIDFGNVTVDGAGGTIATETLVLSNIGDRDLNLSELTLSGDTNIQISALADPVLSPGESTEISLTFDPTVSGELDSQLAIANDGTVTNHTIDIAGFAQSPNGDIRIDVGNNNLGGLALGSEARSQSNFATITNIGGSVLDISDIRIAGDSGKDQFSVIGEAMALDPGESMSVGVAFDAKFIGLQRAKLEVVSDDIDSPVLSQTIVATGLAENGSALDIGKDYVAVATESGPALRTQSLDTGEYSFFLRPNSDYDQAIFDPESGLIAKGFGTTNSSGQPTLLNASNFVASEFPDSDGDGLPDDIEWAIGTGINLADSDNDGIDDYEEIHHNLGGFGPAGFPTGIIGSLNLPQLAEQVVAEGDNLYIATGWHGLAIVDAAEFNNPIQLGQIDLDSGYARDVAIDSDRDLAFVATSQGLDIVDISDPMLPILEDTLLAGNDLWEVELAGNVLLAGGGTQLHSFNADTWELEQTQTLPGTAALWSLEREGDILTTYQHSRVVSTFALETENISELGATLAGSTTVPFSTTVHRISVGDGVAWLPGGGLTTVDVSDPDNPTKIADSTSRLAGRAFALNGEGLGVLAADGNAEVFHYVELYDTSDASNGSNFNTFLQRFDLASAARDVTISRGVAFVGTSNGLEVYNYSPFDVAREAPQVGAIETVPDTVPFIPNIRHVSEKTVIPVTVEASDDVQLSHVELLANGEVIDRDVSFPFDFFAKVPAYGSDNRFVLQARATDTAGNQTLSEPLDLEVFPQFAL